MDSQIPNAGRVDVRLKETALVKIRIPEWGTADQVAAQVEGRDRGLTWEGRYAVQ